MDEEKIQESPDQKTDILKENTYGAKKKPKRFRINMKKPATRILLASLFAVAIIAVVVGTITTNNSDDEISGHAVLEENTDVSETSESSSDSDKNSGTQISSSTSSTASSSAIKDIKLYADVNLESYFLELENIDMTIDAESLTVVTPSVKLGIKPDEEIDLQSFTGKLEWDEGQLILSGEIEKYLSHYLTIDFKNRDERMILNVNQGSININKIELDEFVAVASGEISLEGKMMIRPKLDTIYLENYEGSFVTEMDGSENTVSLRGDVSAIQTTVNGVEVDID